MIVTPKSELRGNDTAKTMGHHGEPKGRKESGYPPMILDREGKNVPAKKDELPTSDQEGKMMHQAPKSGEMNWCSPNEKNHKSWTKKGYLKGNIGPASFPANSELASKWEK